MQSRFSPRDTLIVHLAVYRIALAFLGTCVEKFLPIRSRQTVATVRLAWRNDLSLYALPFEPYVLRQ